MEKKNAVLPLAVTRLLGDRSYDKRKQGALETDQIVKALVAQNTKEANERLVQIIAVLTKDFANSTQANYRKGGLIALAATSIALMQDAADYLEILIPPVLKCFDDPESRVRYYACEALYNMTKVARNAMLVYFNELFDGLCKLYADPDIEVKNGAQLLNSLVKDVVTESSTFNLDKWIPLLRERIKIQDAFIRQLIIGWITLLNSVPEIHILERIPEYLEGLFDMLSDTNKDILQQVLTALADFLQEIKQYTHLDLSPMVPILVGFCEPRTDNNLARVTALHWLHEFTLLGGERLLPLLAEMLGAAISNLPDKEKELRAKAENLNEALLKLVARTEQKIDTDALLRTVKKHLLSKFVHARLAALRWISMLLDSMPAAIIARLATLLPALLKTLQNTNDQIVRLDIEVLARICIDKQTRKLDPANFRMILDNLVSCFAKDRRLLETRGSFIVRQMCLLLDGESIYRTFALTLRTQDPNFAALMVQTLNLILLTAPELFLLRNSVKTSLNTPAGKDLFECLYLTWCHNPVATFSLCLFAQAYELGTALVYQVADLDMTVGLLMQLEKLVQLVESPIFLHLRLQLLEPHRYPFLLKGLYGMLMLLPQSPAFSSLRTRLSSVAHLSQLPPGPTPLAPLTSDRTNNKKKAGGGSWFASDKQENEDDSVALDLPGLLKQFSLIQLKHRRARDEIFLQHSLLFRGKDENEHTSTAP